MTTTPDVFTYLFTQGVLGVVCGGLIYVVIYLNKKNNDKDKEVARLNQALIDTGTGLIKDTTSALLTNSQSNALLAAKIETGKGNA